MKKTLIFIFGMCCFIWLYELGQLFLTPGYQMTWFDQTMSAFTSAIAMITWIFEEMEN